MYIAFFYFGGLPASKYNALLGLTLHIEDEHVKLIEACQGIKCFVLHCALKMAADSLDVCIQFKQKY